jgi:alkyl sulfatase BDS1-like metallo-beta-lactamase superfamily hydrolase
LDYFIDEVKNLRFEALIYEGSRSSNPNKRNYFLTSAFELNKKIVDSSLLDRTSEELLYQISMETMFDVLSTRYNPSKHNIDNYIVCFNFTSGNIKNITLRNQVAVVSSNSKDICNLKVTTDEIEFKKVLIGMINPVKAIAAGNISVEGGSTEFLQFLSKFK